MRMVSLFTENVSPKKAPRLLPVENFANSGKPLANPPAIEGRKLDLKSLFEVRYSIYFRYL